MNLVTLDFETYYDKDYSLSKMSYEEYVNDPRFEMIGVGIGVGDSHPIWLLEDTFRHWVVSIDWDNTGVIMHNAMFDMAILSWKFGIKPKAIFDTLSMARAIHGMEVGNSLSKLSSYYAIGEKGTEVVNALGKHLRDFSMEELRRYADYCKNDVALTWKLFNIMGRDYPRDELRLIDLHIRMFVYPEVLVDRTLLQQTYDEETSRIDKLLDRLGVKLENLSSNDKFADLLRGLGVEPPTKTSPKTGKTAYAFAKTDIGFQQLLESDDANISDLCEARLMAKSTQTRTRTQRLLDITGRMEKLPIPLSYYGAHTGRTQATRGQYINMQNMKRGGALRQAILAPKGYRLGVADSSQIECVVGDTRILTKDRGYVTITSLRNSDLLWDGLEWVKHNGVIFKGYKETVTYSGITGTANHVVYLADGSRLTLGEAKKRKAEIAIGERNGEPLRFVAGYEKGDTYRWCSAALVRMWRMWKEEISALCGYGKWEIYKMRSMPPQFVQKRILCNATTLCSSTITDSLQPHNFCYKPENKKQGICCISPPRNKEFISFLRGFYSLRLGKFSNGRLFRAGNRQDRQRRALRTRKYTAVYTRGKRTKSICQYRSILERAEDVCIEILQRSKTKISQILCHAYVKQRGYTAADSCPPNKKTAWGNESQKKKVAVYDIMNAGPRHRFTANGHIISNCRVLAYMADDINMLDKLRTSDPYASFGSEMFGIPGLSKKTHPALRQASKGALLGAGYGLGYLSFAAQLMAGFMGAPPVRYDADFITSLGMGADYVFNKLQEQDWVRKTLSIPHNCTNTELLIHAAAANIIIDKYRQAAKPVQGLWNTGRDLIAAMQIGARRELKCLRTEIDKLILPNGMALNYPGIKTYHDPDLQKVVTTFGKNRTYTYGGKIVENFTQAIARIIMTDAMLRIARRYKVILTVHDEIVFLVPEAEADEGTKWGADQLLVDPPYLPGIPLAVEYSHADRYGDAK